MFEILLYVAVIENSSAVIIRIVSTNHALIQIRNGQARIKNSEILICRLCMNRVYWSTNLDKSIHWILKPNPEAIFNYDKLPGLVI
jgi:hypothetical protein